MKALELRRSSVLSAPPEEVWRSISTMCGVNFELTPLVRMTYPESMNNLEQLPVGCSAFKSWILLLGLIPFDRHDLTLVEVFPGQGFHEQSQSLWQRVWIHKRSLESHPDGCIISDYVTFAPRLPLVGYGLLPVFRLIFWNRHRNLNRKYNHLLV